MARVDAWESKRMRQSKQGQRAIVTVLSVIAGLLFLTVIFWQQAVSTVPKIAVPNPPMPWNNAHDAYVAAGAALQDSTKIGYAIGTKHTGQGDNHDYTLAQKEALVAENAGVLRKIRSSFKDPYMAPPARSFFALFPYYAKFRGVVRLMALDQQVKEAQGDWNGAANSGLDALYMGAQMGHGATVIGSLVGIACQAIGRRSLWDEVEHLDLAQSRHAIARLEQIMAAQVSTADTLQEEEWATQAGLMEVMRKPGWKTQLSSAFSMSGDADETQSKPNVANLMKGLKLTLIGPRGVLLNYTRYMDAMRARAQARYGVRGPEPPVPDDPINQELAPIWSQMECKEAATQTENSLLLVTIALHAYLLEHHAYPATLAELAPAYLRKIPADPFGPTGTLQYLLTGSKYVLYSVGPDGKDDGGKAIDDPARAANGGSEYSRHVVQNDSKGDIVAGINR